MAQISKKQYRQEIKWMKDIIKGIAVVAEQGTEHTDRERTIRACAALQQRAENLSNMMKMIIIEEQRRAG
jgi:hypothetical protein